MIGAPGSLLNMRAKDMKVRLLLGLILGVGLASSGCAAEQPTYAERLGWKPTDRVILFHCDDAGMSHGANLGAMQALDYGILTSVSTMMPCSWVPEFAAFLKGRPGVDNGLHLTLTSEWSNYRWGPLAGKAAVPGLVDEEGCLWRSVGEVTAHATADEVETEIRAQLDRAVTLGMPITHLDSHMGTLFARPDFFERYMKVGIEKQIPILIMGGHMTYIQQDEPEAVAQFMAAGIPEKVWAAGLPVLDDLLNETYGWSRFEEKKSNIIQALRSLKPGVTMIIVHCAHPTEEFPAFTQSSETRLSDLRVMTDPELKRVIEEEGILLTTWSELKKRRDQAK